MKKLLSLFALILLINSCDDGDLVVDVINFEDSVAEKCTDKDIIFKINNNQILFLDIPASSNAFINNPETREITINTTNRVRYRIYNGIPTSANICESIPPILPIAIEEKFIISGTIVIKTTPIYTTPNPITGRITIASYNHYIVLKNVIFANQNGNQINEAIVFGDYRTAATALPLAFQSGDLKICASNNTIYNAVNNGIYGLYIQNLDLNLLSTTDLGVPKNGLISDTTNKLSYRLLRSAITDGNQNYFCGTTLPANPEVSEEWIGINGTNLVTGNIEVITTTNGPGTFLHTIRLKGVSFKKVNNNSTFYFGNDILLGELITN